MAPPAVPAICAFLVLSALLAAQTPDSLPAAERAAAAAVQAQPSAENYQRLGLALYLQNRFDSAIAALREAVARQNTLWPSHLFLGASLYRTNDFAAAITSLERADKLAPASGEGRDNVDYWLGAARIAARRPLEGLASLERLLLRNPGHVEALQLATETYAGLGSQLWNQVADSAFASSPGQEVHGHALESEGNAAGAEEAYGRSKELAPARPGPGLALGWLLLKAGKTQEAAAEFVRERKLDPSRGEAAFGAGLVALREGRYAAAVEPLATAVLWLQGNSEPALALAQAYLTLHEPAKAAEAARRAVSIEPRSEAAHELLVTALAAAGDAAAAEQEQVRWRALR